MASTMSMAVARASAVPPCGSRTRTRGMRVVLEANECDTRGSAPLAVS